jgi:hypothetical protein
MATATKPSTNGKPGAKLTAFTEWLQSHLGYIKRGAPRAVDETLTAFSACREKTLLPVFGQVSEIVACEGDILRAAKEPDGTVKVTVAIADAPQVVYVLSPSPIGPGAGVPHVLCKPPVIGQSCWPVASVTSSWVLNFCRKLIIECSPKKGIGQ